MLQKSLTTTAAEESDTKVVLSFADLSEEIKEQTVPVGTVYEELELPEELNVFMKQTEIFSIPNLAEEKSEEETVSGNEPETGSKEEEADVTEQEEYYAEPEEITVYTPENSEKEAQELQETVAGVTWQSDPAYEGNAEATYIFTAVLPEGYTLAEGVSLPQITVIVKKGEGGTDFVIQALHDRIAALPDAEEFFATEPDEEDEDAYAGWEEKLYAYAEEVLAIWDEYESLTEEQQAQISEEELAKLTAWVEFAKTLAESSQVMAVDGSTHTHCVCGGKLMDGEYNHTEEIIVYDNILDSLNGQLLLNSNPVTKDEQSGYQLASGNYYLADDVALDSELVITEGSKVYICLNNHTISYNRTNGTHRVITVEDGATLNLCTCGDSGSITGGYFEGTTTGAGIWSGKNTSCNLYSVNICGNNAANGAGILFNGSLNMYGGEIKGNEATGFGGGIATGSTAEDSILQNVKISDNRAGGRAAGLYWAMSGKTLTMMNVEISNNIVSNSTDRNPAGGVALMQGTISISGTIIISGNQYNGEQNNFWNYCNTRNPCKLVIAGDLDEQSEIGLTNKTVPTEDNPAPIEVASGSSHTITDADWSRFFSDDSTYEILLDKTNNLLLLSYPGSCDLLNLTTNGATLSPEFTADNTGEYTSTVDNSVNQVGITATLADTASGADITIKINDGAEANMENGIPKTVGLNEGKNTIAITVTSGGMSKTYTIEITREKPTGFKVTLNGNKGSAGTNLTSYVPGSEVELPTDWTRTGYTFSGWYEDEGCIGTAVTVIPADATGNKEYWAKWTPISYSISYDLEGGTATGNPTSYTIESSAITLNNPTKEGYTFTGWSGTDLTGSNNKSVTIAAGSTGDREYKAHWNVADYTVTLNGNGGQGGTSLISYVHGTGAILPTNWTKTGYTFAGWYEKADCTGTAVTEISATDTGDKTFWAKWTQIGYTISYNLDGGTVTGNPTEYTIESSPITLINPTKTGYSFGGWSGTDLTGSNNMSVTIAAGSTGDREYTAHWTAADYTVTLNGNGGQGGTSLISYAHGTATTLPTDWTRTGYTFVGWYEKADCTGTAVTIIPADATGNKEYWAGWTPISYSITYVLDGGNVSGNPTSYTIESSAITLNNPTREGYTFTGWSGTDLTGNNHMSVTIASGSTGHRTYTANWKLADYTVNLHTNGGIGGTDLTSYTFGTGAVLPTNWKKTGYVFDGWYENDSCTGTPVTNISGTDTGDKEYWAKWTDNIAPVIGTLTFNYQPKNFWHWLIGKDSLIITVPVTEEGSGADEISYTMTPDGGTAKVETAAIQNGEAKITVDADFKGTVSIVCTDKAGNTSAGVTVGAGIASNGIIIEDDAPKIAFQAGNAELLPSGEYKTVPNIVVTVTDDKDNAISGGIASVSYKIGNGSEQSVAHDYTTSMVVHDSFTIPASEIPANGAVISVTATDNAGNSTTETYIVKVHIHSGTVVVKLFCNTCG